MTATLSQYWIVVLVIAAGTFLLRFSFVHWLGQRKLPERLESILSLVPVAVLCALIVPNILFQNGSLDLSSSNPRPLAGLIALLVAMRTKSLFFSIFSGMVALWLVSAWLS